MPKRSAMADPILPHYIEENEEELLEESKVDSSQALQDMDQTPKSLIDDKASWDGISAQLSQISNNVEVFQTDEAYDGLQAFNKFSHMFFKGECSSQCNKLYYKLVIMDL